MINYVDFEILKGKVLTKVDVRDDLIVFYADGETYEMYHMQDCCERVYVESVVGDVNDLIGVPILLAEVSSSDDPNADELGRWTFYKLATIKGYVDIRWYGSSNGYYSVGVSVVRK